MSKSSPCQKSDKPTSTHSVFSPLRRADGPKRFAAIGMTLLSRPGPPCDRTCRGTGWVGSRFCAQVSFLLISVQARKLHKNPDGSMSYDLLCIAVQPDIKAAQQPDFGGKSESDCRDSVFGQIAWTIRAKSLLADAGRDSIAPSQKDSRAFVSVW